MSFSYIATLIAGTGLAFFLVFGLVLSNWRVGLNTQVIKCLPGTVFIIRQSPPDKIERGQMIAYRSRGLLPFLQDGRGVAKLVAAVPGDRVKVDATGVSINGVYWGPLNSTVLRKSGRTAESVSTSYVVGQGELLVLGTLPRSYDGRYWGTIKSDQVIGNAWRLW